MIVSDRNLVSKKRKFVDTEEAANLLPKNGW
jgi:hypothetical protein